MPLIRRCIPPQIILISPVVINSNAPRFQEFYNDDFDFDSMQKSYELAAYLRRFHLNKSVLFDATQFANTGDDGLNLDEKSENVLAIDV